MDLNNITKKDVLTILIVIALGFIIVNGFISFKYKMQLVLLPCDKCLIDNPHLENCFRNSNPLFIINITNLTYGNSTMPEVVLIPIPNNITH